MTTSVQDKSVFKQVLRVYDEWGFQGLVYGATLVLCLGVALVMEFQYQVPPGRVLMYVLPLAAVSLVALPALFFAFHRLVPKQAPSGSTLESMDKAFSFSSLVFKAYRRRQVERYVAEMAVLVRQQEELRQELDRLLEEKAFSKRVRIVRTPYSPIGKGRSGSRSYRFSRPNSEGYKRA